LKVHRFEDLIAWQKGMELAVRVYEISRLGPLAKDFGLSGQLHRAATSVPSNIAEGFDRGSRAEFHHFLSIAKGSCAELQTQLLIAHRVNYLSDDILAGVLEQAQEVSRIVGKLRTTVASHRNKAR
jgi:four helix bundle protein